MAGEARTRRTRQAVAKPSTVLKFITREEARRIRGHENFIRFKTKTSAHTHPGRGNVLDFSTNKPNGSGWMRSGSGDTRPSRAVLSFPFSL
jgi:hypothetical protein